MAMVKRMRSEHLNMRVEGLEPRMARQLLVWRPFVGRGRLHECDLRCYLIIDEGIR